MLRKRSELFLEINRFIASHRYILQAERCSLSLIIQLSFELEADGSQYKEIVGPSHVITERRDGLKPLSRRWAIPQASFQNACLEPHNYQSHCD